MQKGDRAEDAPVAGRSFMDFDFIELCKKRESCRSYTGEPVAEEALRTIVEAGRLAPSACNSQPWHFAVVSGGKSREGVRRAVQVFGRNKFTDKASAFVVIFREKPNYPERVGEVLFGREFSAIDIGITTANMTLAAASLGVGSCILGMFDEGDIKQALGLSKKDKSRVELVLALGMPASDEVRKKQRKPVEEVAVFVK